MANCDLCGRDKSLFRAEIEGTKLNVCKECSRHGEVISAIKEPEKKKEKKDSYDSQPETKKSIYMVREDFSEIIRNKRESLGLDQEAFAKKIREKGSVLHKIETGEFKVGLKLAKKLETILKIKLIESYEEEENFEVKKETESFTIGDIIKIKKR